MYLGTDDNKKKKDSTEVVDAGAAHYIYMMDQHDVTMNPLDVSARSSNYDDVDIKLLESTEFPQKEDGTNYMSETINDSRQATDLENPKKMDETEDMYGTIEDSEETSGTEDRDGRIVNTQGSRRNTQSGPNRVSLGSRLVFSILYIFITLYFLSILLTFSTLGGFSKFKNIF